MGVRSLAATVLLLALASAPARGAGTAVLVVDLEGDGAATASAGAEALRAAFARRGTQVLDREATRRALEARVPRSGSNLEDYRRRFREADEALAVSAPEQSLAVLEALIADLAADPDFSADKQALLETARIKLALRLIGLAGKGETGKAETTFGKRARALLVDALRVNPGLSPSRAEYPPRLFTAIDAARIELLALGTGGMRVESRPANAHVFVEGRHFGQTPLVLGDAVLPRGTYRVWVEASGVRSQTRVVRVGETAPGLVVDLALEAALWTDGPGLRPMAGLPVEPELVRMVGELLHVDRLVLVGRSRNHADGDWLWGVTFSVADGPTGRFAEVRADPPAALPAATEALALFLEQGDRRGVEVLPLPPQVMLGSPSTAAGAEAVDDGGFPWVPVAIAAGSVTLLAAGVGVTIAIIAALPRDGAMTVTVRPIDEAAP